MDFNIVNAFLGMTLLGAAWVLWLLLFLSVLSIAIIFERAYFFNSIKVNYADFALKLAESLNSKDYGKAKELCESNNSLEARVALEGIKNVSRGRVVMEGSMEGLAVSERQKLDRWLVILGTLGNNAPFIGLFGTVIGIIQAFNDLATNPQGGPSVVMSGISEALVATAVGLLVAIPAVVAFNTFNRIVKRHLANAQSTIKVVLTYH